MSRQVGSMAGRSAKVARDATEDVPGINAVANYDGGRGGGAGTKAVGDLMQQVSI